MTEPRPDQLVLASRAAKRLGFERTIDLVRAFHLAGLDVYQRATPRSRQVTEADIAKYLDLIRMPTPHLPPAHRPAGPSTTRGSRAPTDQPSRGGSGAA